MTARTLKLLDLYGAEPLGAAVEEVSPALGSLGRGENVLFRGQSGVAVYTRRHALETRP